MHHLRTGTRETVRTVTACALCGGYGMKHDPIAHDAEPPWITCPECDGEGTVLDRYGLDWTCEGCEGDGGMER